MDLFEVYNGKAIPSAHALLIDPYKSMWNKDTSKDKDEAINMFSYVEFLLSPKKSNIFFGYDDKIKPAKIKQRIWGNEHYISPVYSTSEIIGLIQAYKEDLENSSISYATLNDAILTAQNTREYLRDVNLGETTPSGALKLKPKDVTGALKEIPDIIKTLETTRDNVLAEIKESAKSRNNREIGFFER